MFEFDIRDFKGRETHCIVEEDISILLVDILSGDEVVDVFTKSGESIHFDSSNERRLSLYDGSYGVLPTYLQQWADFKGDSYDRMEYILKLMKDDFLKKEKEEPTND